MPSLRQRIADREELLASFVIELPARATVEAYAVAGFDAVILDLEHSSTDLATLSLLVAACRSVGLYSIVRIEHGALGSVTRVLDMGPDGIMVPGVGSAGEAAAVVAAARHHPHGHRGLAPMVRHALGGDRGAAERDRRTAVIVQLEAAETLGEAAAVAATPGLDMVFIGPYDLSQSVGRPGELDHPDVLRAGSGLAAEIAPHAALGVYAEDAAQVRRWRGLGASCLALRTDGRIFADACRATLEAAGR